MSNKHKPALEAVFKVGKSLLGTLFIWAFKALVFVFWVSMNVFVLLAKEAQAAAARYLFNKEE